MRSTTEFLVQAMSHNIFNNLTKLAVSKSGVDMSPDPSVNDTNVVELQKD